MSCNLAQGFLGMNHPRTVVHGDDVQAVEDLPLVLVDSLHVYVEHGGRVYFHPVLPLQVLGEFHLVVLRERSEICDLTTK